MLQFEAAAPEAGPTPGARCPGVWDAARRECLPGERLFTAECAGCLLLRMGQGETARYAPPIPGPEGDDDAALEAVERLWAEREAPPVLAAVTGARLSGLLDRYPYVHVRAFDGPDGRTYRLELRNELRVYVRRRPELKTARLTLSAPERADIPAYNALLLDTGRNRWWGYDDAAALADVPGEDRFLLSAQEDFTRCAELSLAVRLKGVLIGETVLHHFNYRGSAELGCRICRAQAGHGYGTEAFAAAAEWALYQLRLRRVTAKCVRENEPSRRMLASCMHPVGEDETFYYFEKDV